MSAKSKHARLDAALRGYEQLPFPYGGGSNSVEQAQLPVGLLAGVLVELEELMGCPLTFLSRVWGLLRDQGRCVFLIEEGSMVAERLAAAQRRAFYLGVLARRCGFAVTSEFDCHFGSMAPLLVIEKIRTPRWRLMEPGSEDMIALMDLFRISFGTEMSPGLWCWKYGGGRGRAVIAVRNGNLVAHYGATTRHILFNGRRVSALQVCDVMVAPTERAVFTKRGAFSQVAGAFLEEFFGFHDEHILAFGFPNERAMRIAERMGLYAEVSRITEFQWGPLEAQSRADGTSLALTNRRDLDSIVATLWTQMQEDLTETIVVIRDSAYLTYRYLLRPDQSYEIFTVIDRNMDRPQGLIVLRHDKEECKLLDIVAPLKNIPLLVEHARHQTGRWGLPRVTSWITTPYAALFTCAGGQQTTTEVCIPTNIWTNGPSVDQLKNRWWLMMGDTDFL